MIRGNPILHLTAFGTILQMGAKGQKGLREGNFMFWIAPRILFPCFSMFKSCSSLNLLYNFSQSLYIGTLYSILETTRTFPLFNEMSEKPNNI